MKNKEKIALGTKVKTTSEYIKKANGVGYILGYYPPVPKHKELDQMYLVQYEEEGKGTFTYSEAKRVKEIGTELSSEVRHMKLPGKCCVISELLMEVIDNE